MKQFLRLNGRLEILEHYIDRKSKTLNCYSYLNYSHPSSSAVPMVMIVPSGVVRGGSLLK